jgi:hypothetical protein
MLEARGLQEAPINGRPARWKRAYPGGAHQRKTSTLEACVPRRCPPTEGRHVGSSRTQDAPINGRPARWKRAYSGRARNGRPAL